MQAILQYFFKDYNFRRHSTVFKASIYCLVIIKCLYWLAYYKLFFGEDAVIYRAEGHSSFIKDLAYILYNNKDGMLPLYFIIVSILICIFMLVRRKNNLAADLALWLLVVNLHYSVYATLTGGDYLLNQLLFFNIFIAIDFKIERRSERELMVCLHNAAISAIMVQVCIVYLVAGLAKLDDPHWMLGSAIEMVNSTNRFSLGVLTGEKWNPVYRFLNYVVIVYQLLFPLLILFSKFKVPVLVLGVLIHLYIAVMLGLPAFSMVMLLAYIYFWPQRRATAQI